MTIHTYAVLKDFFDKEFVIDDAVTTIESLQQLLMSKKPAAENVLSSCRFAVKDEFVNNDFILQPGDIIHIIPPSSGG